MYKFLKGLLFFVLIIPLQAHGQETFSQSNTDSITYVYFLKGDWDKLILAGKESIKQHIDFKWLHQRMGYAYFAKADYFASQQQYEKALIFDKSDTLTLTYLYYCGLYTNNESNARFHASKLPVSIQNRLGMKPLRIFDAFDTEYNYKINSEMSRSNPGYYRIGLNTQPCYRLNLYQAFSTYFQRIDSMGITQKEYFVLADYSISSHLSLDLGYHYLVTSVVNTSSYRINRRMKTTIIDSTFYPGNLLYSKLAYRKNRFDLALSASILSFNSTLTQQYGIQAGVVLPGKLNLYLKSSIYGMLDPDSRRLIFSQSAGSYLFNALWVEGNITLGNLKNFTETNGLYIYNSEDATVFRTGLSLYWHVTKKLILVGNYSYNKKQYDNKDKATISYDQHSISSGIIWKM